MALTNLNPNLFTTENKTASQAVLESAANANAVPGSLQAHPSKFKNPLAVAAWLSALVGINNLVLNVLLAQGSFNGSEEVVLNLIVVTEAALATFTLIAVSGALLPRLVRDLQRVVVGVDLPLMLANGVLSLSTIWSAFMAPAAIYSQTTAEHFSLFAMAFCSALFLRSKGSSLFRKAAPATLSELAPTGRVVRPMDKFNTPNEASQGVLFPPEESVIVNSSALKEGDVVRVMQNEFAPCDGVVSEGSAIVEERKYVGNTALRAKERGAEIFAGSKIVSGSLDIKIGLTQSESIGASFDSAISISNEAPLVTKDREHYLTLANLTLVFAAVLGGVVTAYETEELSAVASVVASILSITLLAIPLDLVSGLKEAVLSRAFVKGLLIKGSSVLDKLTATRVPVFSADPLSLFREPRGVTFDVMDSRIDRKVLGNVVLALSLRAEHQIFREVVRLLVQKEKLSFGGVSVEDFREYDSRGVLGNVSGTEVTIGHEDFLLDRGVHLQSSDLATQGGSQALFVAIGEDIVARIIFESPAAEFKTHGLDPLKTRGVRAVLLGAASQNMLDVQGQKLGFELSSIFGALDDKAKAEKVGALGDILLFDEPSRLGLNGDGGIARSVSVTVFDERVGSGSEGEVVVFNRGPEVLSCLNSLGEKLRWARTEAGIVAALAAICLVAPLIVGQFSPLIPACLAVVIIGYAYLWPARIGPILGQ